MKLEGLVAIVTGGASGLGEAAVRQFLREGCGVVIADTNESAGLELESQFNPSKVLFVRTDVTNEESVNNMIRKTLDKFGKIHILVNSAGVVVKGHTFSKSTNSELLKKILLINLVGTFICTKLVAGIIAKQEPLNEKNERGVIINVASVAGIEGGQGMLIYSTSKGGVLGMTLPLARDLGKSGIRVMAIAPSTFKTPMMKAAETSPAIEETLSKLTALGRLGEPKEFADVCIAVCKSTYLTGSVIRLDGGARHPHL